LSGPGGGIAVRVNASISARGWAPARQVARGLLDEGFFTNAATYPAVPLRQAGVRFMLTLHHRPSDIEHLVAALSSQLRHVLDTAEAGAGSPQRRPGRQAVSALS
jgi:hypothetical protein